MPRLYDLPLVVGILAGVVLAIVLGPVLEWLLIGFAAGNLITWALRYTAGSNEPTLNDRFRTFLNGRHVSTSLEADRAHPSDAGDGA